MRHILCSKKINLYAKLSIFCFLFSDPFTFHGDYTQHSKVQDLVDLIRHDWSKTNLFQQEINCDKTKELSMSSLFPSACIDGNSIESDCAKLLGVMINVNLTWNEHIEQLENATFLFN